MNGRKVGQTFNGVIQEESDVQNPFLKSLRIDEMICGKDRAVSHYEYAHK